MNLAKSILFFALVACSVLAASPDYSDAELFAPRLRDRLGYSDSNVITPAIDGDVLELTDESCWTVTGSLESFAIGDSVMLEEVTGLTVDVEATLVNLRTLERVKVRSLQKTGAVRPELPHTKRGLRLPRYDKCCLFKLDTERDIIQVGAQRSLWEFDAVLDGVLPDMEWRRGSLVEIRASGHPDYPYWIIYHGRGKPWVHALLVKAYPRELKRNIDYDITN